jgi:hypothetical protein
MSASFRSSKPNSRQASNPLRRTQRETFDPSLSCSRVRAGPERLHDSVRLSPTQKADILARMRDSEAEVVATMTGKRESLTLWKPRGCKKGISYYVDEHVAKGQTRFCCVGLTDAPVADIMRLFMVTDTETLLKNVRVMYRNVSEAKIVSVLQQATPAEPYRSVYIRYASFDTPTLMKGRDICVCVCTNLEHSPDGPTLGYCLWDSVDIPQCPERSDTDGIIRSRMRHSGFFFRNSGKPGALTKVCYLINMEVRGLAPQLSGSIYMGIFGGNCWRVCKHYRNRSLEPETFKRRAEWTPKRDAKNCFRCDRRFYPFVPRHHCVSCGEVVCGSCNCFEDVSVRGAVITRVRVCKSCLADAGMLRSNQQTIVAQGNHESFDSDESGVRDLLRTDSSSEARGSSSRHEMGGGVQTLVL